MTTTEHLGTVKDPYGFTYVGCTVTTFTTRDGEPCEPYRYWTGWSMAGSLMRSLDGIHWTSSDLMFRCA